MKMGKCVLAIEWELERHIEKGCRHGSRCQLLGVREGDAGR